MRRLLRLAARTQRPAQHNGGMHEVEISDSTIRLGQLLKLAGVAEHGAEAKALLEEGEVLVNDAVETRRGRQLTVDDEVSVGTEEIRIIRA